MATKSTTLQLSEQEIQFQRRVKSIELAIKATVGKNGSSMKTVLSAAKEIYDFLSEQK